MQKADIVATEEECEQAVKDMHDEWNEMDQASYPFYWIWGQKPVDSE